MDMDIEIEMDIDINDRITPEYIEDLKENEIFVFGSNTPGLHVGGAANIAHNKWGAKWGKGTGLHGRTYAIPTISRSLEEVREHVDKFIEFAKKHSELTFLVTPITENTDLRPIIVAPLFLKAKEIENIYLPNLFWQYLSFKEI